MQFDLRDTLCAIVRAQSIHELAISVSEAVGRSTTVALARVWVADSAGGLQLFGSAGTPSGGGSYSRTDGEFRSMAVAEWKIAEIAAARESFVVGLRGDEDWLTNPSWAARQGVRAFLAFPLLEKEAVVGVVAIFSRSQPSSESRSQLQLIADLTAARVADLQARAGVGHTSVFTRAELRRVERQNIESALARSRGKVFGVNGAAALLGMRPTTLASRIKALGIADTRNLRASESE